MPPKNVQMFKNVPTPSPLQIPSTQVKYAPHYDNFKNPASLAGTLLTGFFYQATSASLLDVFRKDFKFFCRFKELFAFVVISLVYSPS
jgi:hypothetical protein